METTLEDLQTEFRLSNDGDSWGACMGWLFALCDYLTFEKGEDVPDSWGFRPALGGANLESYEFGQLLELEPSADLAAEFAERLWRVRGILKAQGRDY